MPLTWAPGVLHIGLSCCSMSELQASVQNTARCSGLTGQGRVQQGKARQGRVQQARAGYGRAWQGRAGRGRAGQGRAGQGTAGQGRAVSLTWRADLRVVAQA